MISCSRRHNLHLGPYTQWIQRQYSWSRHFSDEITWFLCPICTRLSDSSQYSRYSLLDRECQMWWQPCKSLRSMSISPICGGNWSICSSAKISALASWSGLLLGFLDSATRMIFNSPKFLTTNCSRRYKRTPSGSLFLFFVRLGKVRSESQYRWLVWWRITAGVFATAEHVLKDYIEAEKKKQSLPWTHSERFLWLNCDESIKPNADSEQSWTYLPG